MIVPGRPRLVRLTGYVLAGMLLLVAVAYCLAPPQRPQILFATGYERGPFLFEPLKQQKWPGWLSIMLRKDVAVRDYVHTNWDGQHLLVDGWCGACGKPYAPRGAFVLAILPNGLAHAKREPHPTYNHLGKPIHISRTSVLLAALAISSGLVFLLGPGPRLARQLSERLRPAPGCCRTCGYNLTGNVSGTCPECGDAI